MKPAKYKKILVTHSSGDIQIYAKPAHADALEKISNMSVYDGTKILALLGEVYRQGKKEGAKSVFDGIENMKKAIPHKNPGKPKRA